MQPMRAAITIQIFCTNNSSVKSENYVCSCIELLPLFDVMCTKPELAHHIEMLKTRTINRENNNLIT